MIGDVSHLTNFFLSLTWSGRRDVASLLPVPGGRVPLFHRVVHSTTSSLICSPSCLLSASFGGAPSSRRLPCSIEFLYICAACESSSSDAFPVHLHIFLPASISTSHASLYHCSTASCFPFPLPCMNDRIFSNAFIAASVHLSSCSSIVAFNSTMIIPYMY